MISLLGNVQILVISKKLVNKLHSVGFNTSLWLGVTQWITNEISNWITNEISIYIYISEPKQPSCKKCAPQKSQGEKRCEIQGGCQEMAVMVG